MFFLILYILIAFVEVIFAFFLMIFALSLLYSSAKGSPYVPTRNKEVDVILQEFPLDKNSYLIELGCGDGRMVRNAVKNYKIKGLGIDVNPLLVILARFYARLKKITNIEFKTQNIFDPKLINELKKADIIYLFLMPKLITKLAPVLEKNCKKNSIIISHGFKFENWEKMLHKKITRQPFPTYFYRM